MKGRVCKGVRDALGCGSVWTKSYAVRSTFNDWQSALGWSRALYAHRHDKVCMVPILARWPTQVMLPWTLNHACAVLKRCRGQSLGRVGRWGEFLGGSAHYSRLVQPSIVHKSSRYILACSLMQYLVTMVAALQGCQGSAEGGTRSSKGSKTGGEP